MELEVVQERMSGVTAGVTEPRRARRVGLLFTAFFVFVLVFGTSLGVWIMSRGYSPVPFADFWMQFDFIERALRGEVGIDDFWAQHNEHRIVVARLQFLLDYGVFGGANVFLFVAIALSSLALAGLFAVAVYLDTRERLLAFGTFAVAAASTMSTAGVENLTWAFQGQFVQVFLFAALSVLSVVAAARSRIDRRRTWLTALTAFAGIAATYSMANGLFAWPIVVGLALAIRLERRLTATLALVGALTIATYAWRLEFSTRGELSDPVGLVTFVAVYLGSAVWGAGIRAAGLVGAVGLALVPVLFVLAWRRRSGASIALPFGAGVTAFILLTAMQTAAGRLSLGTSQALSSRYSIASFTFWLALLVAFLVPLRERLRGRPNAGLVYLACAAAATLFVSYRTIPDPDWLRTMRFGREATVLTYRVGARDDSGTVTGVEAGDTLVDAFRWMEQGKLGPWVPGGMVDGMLVTGPDRSTARACRGAIELSESVKRGHRLRGWIAAPAAPYEPTSRNLVVLSDDRHAGLGLVGTHRPDVGTESEWTGFVAYLPDKPAGPLSVVLLSDDRRTPVCRLLTTPTGS